MGFLQNIFGSKSGSKVMELLGREAVVIDVRSPAEFRGGHVPKSKNIPLNEIRARMGEIKKLNKPVVLCCASGARSGQAASYLQREGIECQNGGSWTKVKRLQSEARGA